MKKSLIVALCFAIACGYASAKEKFHDGKTTLSADEKAIVMKVKEKEDKGFSILWKNPNIKEFGVMKWDSDSCFAVPDAPNDILDSIRDQVGKLNQKDRKGEEVKISATIFKYKKQSFLSNPVAYYELVARNKDGKTVWIAIDQIKPCQELATSLADTDSNIVGREIHRKIREEFSL